MKMKREISPCRFQRTYTSQNRNVGIATSLALTMFDGDDLNDAMGVPFFYGMVEGVFIGVYCLWAWKSGWTKAPAGAPIWTVLWTSYEVLEAESIELSEIEISMCERDQHDDHSDDGRSMTHYFNASSTRMDLKGQLV